MRNLLRDLRYALRQLQRSPGFALTAILTLAIGIGGMTAVFSVVDSVLLRPLPFPHSGRLIVLHEKAANDQHELRVSAPDILTFQQDSKTFSGIGGYIAVHYALTGAGAPLEAGAQRVTASLFPVLGVPPLLGRTFTQREDTSSAPVAVISYALWKGRFQSSPNVLGKTVDLDQRPYTIIGVMPRNFEFPLDAGRLSNQDLWVPMSFTPAEKASGGVEFDYGAIARLKPGVSMAQAQSDVDRVIAIIQTGWPAKGGLRLHGYFLPLKLETVRNARPLLNILLAAVGLILLIACVNLANLLLVRAAGRRHELGMRLALGAARRRVLRQLLTESILLSAIGGACGVVLAGALVQAAASNLPDSLPRLGDIAVRWPVFAVGFGLAGLTGVLCGLAPALAGARIDILHSLRDSSQSAGTGHAQHRLRSVFVAVEVALAMLLLIASGLLLRSFAKMLETDPGFQPQHVLTASLSLPLRTYPNQQKVNEFYARLQRRLEALPGVRAVGFSSNIPIVGQNSGRLIAPEGYVPRPGDGWLIVSNYLLQGNYFTGMHIPLIRGRYFDAGDEQNGAPLVVVISQSFAEKYFHGKNPIGLRIKTGPSFDSPMPAMAVVGVVGDIKQGALDQATVAQMYEPLSQRAGDLGPMASLVGIERSMDVVIRTTDDPATLITELEKTVHGMDPVLPLSDIHTMDQVMAATESSRRFNTAVLTSFAAIALLLSLLGIYGVLAYSVREGTREIAIRMALDSTREAVLWRTLKNALGLAALGIVAGLIASLGLMHFLSSLLYGVKAMDGIMIAGAVLLLFACSFLAGWLPARRAASVDPMQALRAE